MSDRDPQGLTDAPTGQQVYEAHGWSGCDGSRWERLSQATRDGWEYAARLSARPAATTDTAAQAQAWFEGAQAATDWIKDGARVATMPDNPYGDPGTRTAHHDGSNR